MSRDQNSKIQTSFDRKFVKRIREATDLLALIGSSVNLHQDQERDVWIGACSCGSDEGPCLNVVPSRRFYQCWKCGRHGDAFRWIMDEEGLTFDDALRKLAQAAGIELPFSTQENGDFGTAK